MLMWLYRRLAGLIYMIVYPLGRAKAAAGSKLWQGRLGLIDAIGPVDIWLHASSAGEVKVIGYLINYLKARTPELRIHITVMTSAGFQAATNKARSVTFFPIDAGPAIRRTFDAINPTLLVIAETEIWPNLVNTAKRRSVPLIMVNSRMTERAFDSYRRISGSIRQTLDSYERFFFKTSEDSERYRFFGVPESKLQVVGDMKFDAPIVERTPSKRADIRSRFAVPEDAFLIVAGSTRSGEETILAAVYAKLRASHDSLFMVLAPRHVQRADSIVADLLAQGLDISVMRAADTASGLTDTAGGLTGTACNLILVDRMGLLGDLYVAADVAFVGGTLVNIGGHNLLEPVWAGTPVLFGPSIHNVTEAADYITEHGYGAMVADDADMTAHLEKMLSGKLVFDSRTSRDTSRSPSAIAGDYILSRLANA